MEDVVIVSAKRTPIGSFLGTLADIPAPRLGAIAIKAAIKEAGIDPQEVQECIMGEVLTSGVGQAPARQAAIYAGLPKSTQCMTINKVCGSGLKAVMLAHNEIKLNLADIIVAGGQENMSQAPYILKAARDGLRLGHKEFMDSMILDGLWDPYDDMHMGSCAELCASKKEHTRQAQDAFAIESYKRANKAQKEGFFDNEIAEVPTEKKKQTITVKMDEEPQRVQFEKIPKLRPAFEKAGSITAANASKINDGAAALVLMSGKLAEKKGIKPIAKILSQASFAMDPKWFTLAPTGAIKKALEIAQLKPSDIDLWEINEAFATQTMAVMEDIGIPENRLNINGGAIALGHPIGASGARILTTLLHALQRQKHRRGSALRGPALRGPALRGPALRGLASLCIGGGEGSALIVESM